jgi:hypothetical protein
MLPTVLLRWLKAHLLLSGSAATDAHADRMTAADEALAVQARRRAEYTKRIAAAERKYKSYGGPLHK